jgi:hypothetical protein
VLERNQFDLSLTVEWLICNAAQEEESHLSDIFGEVKEEDNESEKVEVKSTTVAPSNNVQVFILFSWLCDKNLLCLLAFIVTSQPPICKYYLQGKCLVRNCPFRHSSVGMFLLLCLLYCS